MPATLLRRRLDSTLEPTAMLRVFRERDGLFGLIGDWYDGRTVIGFDPAERLGPAADPFAVVSGLPPPGGAAGFGGGWVGAFGYQLGSRLEHLPPAPPRPVPLPDATLAYYDHVLVRDSGGWWFEALVDDANRSRVERASRLVGCRLHDPDPPAAPYECTAFVATPDAAGHRSAVATTLDRLAAGDIFQANVCRRFQAELAGDPLDLFCAGVDRLGPAYAAFLRTPDGAVASLSPELFLRRTGRRVRTSPIKGTAPLDVDVERLVGSAKERAENVMIVDLMRNDLGRVCVPGSVQVEAIARAEQRAGVWHLVSDIVGTLAPGEDDGTLLRATFPPGSVTGAPKVRAMEVIHEVETTGRESYTGAIGYVSPGAGLELNVAIRTFELSGATVWFGAGGGVVIDSTPEGERVETLVKAAPLLAAVGARFAAQERDLGPVATSATANSRTLALPILHNLPSVDESRGIFTTLLVVDGEAVDLAGHVDRLGESVMARFGPALPADLPDRIAAVTTPLCGRHRLRVEVRPCTEGFCEPTITTTALPAAARSPLRLTPVVVPGGLGAHKLSDRRRLSVVEPTDVTWTAGCDALVTDVDGALLETGRGNLFIVTDAAVHTPALDGRLLPGVTRQRAIDELAAVGVAVVECRLGVHELAVATEVFVTSSLDRVRPVTAIDGVGSWQEGRTTRWLSGRLDVGRRTEPVTMTVRRRPRQTPPTLLLIDNYDSFVYNLDQYVRELGGRSEVVRNDAMGVEEICRAVDGGELDGVVISPGPGTPADAGVSIQVVERLRGAVPILGVCLGHQCIASAYGARIVPAETVVHGKASLVHHDGEGVFAGLDGPLVAGRYHSLVVSDAELPTELLVTARTGSGVVMGLRHREYPVEGVQFHPESILSRHGHRLLDSFLEACSRPR